MLINISFCRDRPLLIKMVDNFIFIPSDTTDIALQIFQYLGAVVNSNSYAINDEQMSYATSIVKTMYG